MKGTILKVHIIQVKLFRGNFGLIVSLVSEINLTSKATH